MTAVEIVAGIGFTMAISIADLAFEPALLRQAKVAILAASMVTGVGGYLVGRLVLRPARSPVAAPTESEAEGSTAT